MDDKLADTVKRIIKEKNIDSSCINLEITETAASYNQNVMIENIEELMRAGFSFSLDDYGTGYSNIERVSHIPFKLAKLDKTFVDTLDKPRMPVVLNNTIRMLKEMDMQVVVEGVETFDMLKAFTDLSCDYIQGFYFSKPLPKDEFLRFLEEKRQEEAPAT